jgi:hypothetical protein
MELHRHTGSADGEDATEIWESERMKHIRDATDRWLHVKRGTARASSDSTASHRQHRLPAAPAVVLRRSSLARRHAASLPSPTVVARPRVERSSRRSASRAEEGIRVAATAAPSVALPWLACIIGRREEKTKTKERRAVELWLVRRRGKEKKEKKKRKRKGKKRKGKEKEKR